MRFIIKNYVDKICIEDILKFGFENDIYLENNEAEVLFFYLKNNWEDLIYNDPIPIINEIELKLGKNKTKKITDLFYLYKEKYKDYL